MVAIRSRASWGARTPRSRQTVPWSARKEVTLHYSSGPTSQTPRQIQDFHMDGRGWSDVGYNFLVDKNGVAYEGRGWTVVGAHAAPRNTEGIGICYIGGDGMTDAAKRTVVELYDEACRRAGRTLARKGHRDINSTSCPGSRNYAWWTSSGFRDVAGAGAPTTPSTDWLMEVVMSLPTLKRGAKGSAVARSQALLAAAGYPPANSFSSRGEPDGIAGPGWETALRKFQAAKKVKGSVRADGTGDGVCGRHSWERLIRG